MCIRDSRENGILRRYHLQDREDYRKYNKLCGAIGSLAAKLKKLPNESRFRAKMTDMLLTKLYNMGLITTKKSLKQGEQMTVSAFCRRRLPVVLVRLKMAEGVRQAVTLVEQGHVRVGPNAVSDPAMLVTRSMEDFVTWVDTSKIRRKINEYNNTVDDYDLLAV
eukprot:TRINITY_DN20310_c0_g1_i1.p1 TRINITY_DN20310_c0_g1~~TRINITY_DN20310_c0_g1_i1.p1  ORF type:complete len:164 (+),score=52.56 TRINITY_DN20310_c0_g1_i1:167-658(+)